MYILGNSSDDKGKQLEQLTHDLLRAMHYTNVTTNVIRSGGEEVDVRADYRVPSPAEEHTVRLICECKAHREALDTTDWLKFLGKILIEELNADGATYGCLIALNGVNGNVAGSYEDIHRRKKSIQLISGEELTKLTGPMYKVASVETVQAKLKTYTDRQFQQAELAYRNRHMYWIIAFEGDGYTILDNNGDTVEDKRSSEIGELIEKTTSYHPYIDLQQEKEAIRRNDLVQRAIITLLMANDGQIGTKDVDVNTVLRDSSTYTQAETEQAISRLVEKELVVLEASGERLSLRAEVDSEIDLYDLIITLYRFMLEDTIVIDALKTQYYKKHINEQLVQKIQMIQGGLELPREDIDKILVLLQISPRAMIRSINPIPIIASHRDQFTDERGQKFDANYYIGLLYQSLGEDFFTTELPGFYYQHCGLREIETIRRTIVKNDSGVLLDQEISERTYIGPAGASLGGGYAHVRLFHDAPQPWEQAVHDKQNTS